MVNDSYFSSRSPSIVRLKEVRERQVFVGSKYPHSLSMTLCVTVCPCFCPHQTFLYKRYSGWLTVNSTQHQTQIQRFLWTLPPALAIACALILITNLLLYITGGSPLIVPLHKLWGESTKEMIFMTISASRSRFVIWAFSSETAVLCCYGASFQI